MRFGPVPVAAAEGAILARSLAAGVVRLKKGRALSRDDVLALEAAGIAEVTVAQPEPGDVAEDAAAEAVARAFAPDPAALGQATGRPRVAAIVLAAGASRRMRGRDKLLEPVAGAPVLHRVAEAARASAADEVVAVIPPRDGARRAALEGTGVAIVEATDCAEGMAASLRAGLAAVAARADAVVVLLADMPEIEAGHIDRLIAAYDPGRSREICRAVAADGRRGHPVLFGRRFFESLAELTGDRGARDVVRQAQDFVTDVALEGTAAVTDLDTPEDWAAWRARARD